MRIAVAQSPGVLEGDSVRLSWLEYLLPQLSDVDLLVLPELFLTGYNIGDELLYRAVARDAAVARFGDLAKTHEVALHFGFSEAVDGAVYNASACVGVDGAEVSAHRKMMIPNGHQGVFQAGDAYSFFEFGGFRVATLIGYEAEFPESFRAVTALGADLVIVPTAIDDARGAVVEKLMPARALENGVFVICANHGGAERGLTYHGGSAIVAPDGADLARAKAAPEVLVADLEHAQVARARMQAPYFADREKLPKG